ncbi:RING-H2 finger protein ATL13-like protein [Drosera capensis]
MECIDTWLLSHSTCPLCRTGLLLDFPSNRARSPVVFVLESGCESSREFGEAAFGRTNSVFGSSSRLGIQREAEFGSTQFELSSKSFEIRERKEDNVGEIQVEGDKIVQVKLGKFKNVDVGEGSSEDNVHSRRCYSMGSFAYVLDETSSMQVPIRTPAKKQSTKKRSLPINPGCRTAISEYGADSRRDFNGIEAFRSISAHHSSSGSKYGKPNSTVQTTKKESFSMSKIWMRVEQKQKCFGEGDPSMRAFSSRFPAGNTVIDRDGGGDSSSHHGVRRTISERSELGFDEETQSCYSLDSEVLPPSTNTARTLLWLMGRQNKVVRSSCSSNVQ